jgi:hypothetical protein
MAFHLAAVFAIRRARYLVETAKRSHAFDSIVTYHLGRLRVNMRAAAAGFVFACVGAAVAAGYLARGDNLTRHLRLPGYIPVHDDYVLANYLLLIVALLYLSGAMVSHRATAKEMRDRLDDALKATERRPAVRATSSLPVRRRLNSRRSQRR